MLVSACCGVHILLSVYSLCRVLSSRGTHRLSSLYFSFSFWFYCYILNGLLSCREALVWAWKFCFWLANKCWPVRLLLLALCHSNTVLVVRFFASLLVFHLEFAYTKQQSQAIVPYENFFCWVKCLLYNCIILLAAFSTISKSLVIWSSLILRIIKIFSKLWFSVLVT